jgi:pimeloyl-ACP methyl ester carboxylesterase
MTTFLLLHGARHGAWCWAALSAALERHGHRAIAMDLPVEDERAGARKYADAAAAAARGVDEPVTVVAHSLGGLVAPLVAELRPVAELVFVCSPLPVPGRSLADQLADEPDMFVAESLRPGQLAGGQVLEPEEQYAIRTFFHDCPPDVARDAAARLRRQTTTVQGEPSPVRAWPPSVPTRYVMGRRDRILSPAWTRAAVPARLGVAPIELDTGHSPFLAAPEALATAVLSPSA